MQLKALKRVIAHPRYNQGARFSNDAALLELSTPAEINEYVSPVCLPNVDVYGNETGLVSGYCHSLLYIFIYIGIMFGY